MIDCARQVAATEPLSSLPFYDQTDGGPDEAVCLPESIDQVAPVRDPHTLRVADKEHKGGGRSCGLRRIVKSDRPFTI